MDLSLAVKLIALLLIGLAYFIHSGRQIRALNRKGEELQRQWDALGLDPKPGGGEEVVLSESQQRKISAEEPMFVAKLVRMEALSIRLGQLLGHSIFVLQKSPMRPEGKWSLDVMRSYHGRDYYNIDGGQDDVAYVILKERVKGWWRYKWIVVMQYQRDFEIEPSSEKRHMFIFKDSVVAVLDTLSDELEEQIARASRATEEHREQFRRVVEDHPREERNRFDNIDPIP